MTTPISAQHIFHDQSKADQLKILDYLKDNPTSRRIFKYDFTERFFQDMLDRRDSKIEKHLITFTWGFTGSFKSGVGIEWGRIMDKNFSVDKIAFTDNELLTLVENSKKHEYILRDEVTSGAEFGVGSTRQRAFITVQAETLRAHQTSFGYISPTPKPIGTEHYIMHCIGHNNFKVNDAGIPTEPVYVLLGAINPLTQNYLGGVIQEIEWNNKVWLEYWKRKQVFLQQVTQRNFQKVNFSELAEKVMALPEAQYAKKKYEWLNLILTVRPDLTTEETKYLYGQIAMKRREQG